MIDELWSDYGVRESAKEFAKALKKDEALAKLKLEFMLAQIDKVRGMEKRPIRSFSPIDVAPPTKPPATQDEEGPLPPPPPQSSPGQKYDGFQKELADKLKGKAGEFFVMFDINYPVNQIPDMLAIAGLPFIMPEGPSLYQGPMIAQVTENGLIPPSRQTEQWQVKFQPKM